VGHKSLIQMNVEMERLTRDAWTAPTALTLIKCI